MNKRLQQFSSTTRIAFWVLLVVLIMGLVYGIFSTQFGQNVLICCCGGGLVVAVVGILSERGMRRPR
ncbi:MAG: hypothetical protein R3E39_19675 [Anaerolineae bacterium]